EFNAFTGKEYTGYYVKCAAEFRDTALDVLVDMLRNSKFAEEEIEREKGVIVEEMNMYYDTPRDFIGGVYEELLYGDQPLGWAIPTVTCCSCSRPCWGPGCRHGCSPRCASVAGSRTTCSGSATATPTRAPSTRRPASISIAPTRPSR